MNSNLRRIAINVGSGYVPGIDLIVAGATLAANELGLEIVGIHDGYDGLLYPERYPDGGMMPLSPKIADAVGRNGSLIGTAARTDPFCVRTINENEIEEIDRSADVLDALRAAGIDAVISLVGGSAITGLHSLSVALKLHRRGLRTVCVPKSIENEISSVPQAFGYNSVLSHTAETLDRVRTGARDAGRVAVVEVPGQHSGWLALQSGLAALADAILLPEIPYDLANVVVSFAQHEQMGRQPALVVVAEGARPVKSNGAYRADGDGMRASLTPNADPELGEGEHTIDRSGAAAESVAVALQRLTNRDVLPFSLGHLVRGGTPTTVDRQLGLAYGAGAVRALDRGEDGVLIVFDPPEFKTIPLGDALSRVRTVPAQSELMQAARTLGVTFGDERQKS